MTPGTDSMPKPPRGFAIPGYAAAAAKKGQVLGLTRKLTPAEAARAVRERKWRPVKKPLQDPPK